MNKETSTKTVNFKGRYIQTVGRRKTSTVTVRLYQGAGSIMINDKPIDQYFTINNWQKYVYKPFELTGTNNKFDISIHAKGGGQTSQADAIRLGIARALVEYSADNRSILRKTGMLTRDSRMKERKKFGLKRARKAPQFSKR
ncbi:MAG: 30S ribosomal protein S9 [Patescibacteria group bacterium]